MVENLFSVPVFVDILSDIDNAAIKDYCKKLQREDVGTTYTNVGGWHSSTLTGQIPELNSLFGEVLRGLNELHDHVGFKKNLTQQIAHAWVNINKRGDYNKEHFHRGWCFSAVYYVEAPENCGNLVLRNPATNIVYHYDGSLFEAQTSLTNELYVKPETGKLLIFPSFLSHLVEPSNSDQDRISIALDSKIIEKVL